MVPVTEGSSDSDAGVSVLDRRSPPPPQVINSCDFKSILGEIAVFSVSLQNAALQEIAHFAP